VPSNLPIDGHSFRRVEVFSGMPRRQRWNDAEKAAITERAALVAGWAHQYSRRAPAQPDRPHGKHHAGKAQRRGTTTPWYSRWLSPAQSSLLASILLSRRRYIRPRLKIIFTEAVDGCATNIFYEENEPTRRLRIQIKTQDRALDFSLWPRPAVPRFAWPFGPANRQFALPAT
jgi:hypothetical protein